MEGMEKNQKLCESRGRDPRQQGTCRERSKGVGVRVARGQGQARQVWRMGGGWVQGLRSPKQEVSHVARQKSTWETHTKMLWRWRKGVGWSWHQRGVYDTKTTGSSQSLDGRQNMKGKVGRALRLCSVVVGESPMANAWLSTQWMQVNMRKYAPYIYIFFL